MLTAAQWIQVLTYCGVRFTTAVVWSKVFEARVLPDSFDLGMAELPDFVGQTLYETQLLEKLEEDLNYSAIRLTQVWPNRFPTIAAAAPFAFNPQALANKTYGGRMGNVHPGDGWLFRGRGIPMITGRAGYAALAQLTGLPLLDQPDLLAMPDGALQCGVLWFAKHVPDSAIGDPEAVTQAVQGGELGLADREALTTKAAAAIASVLSQLSHVTSSPGGPA